MATDTMPVTTPPTTRHYWQLPTFALGLAAAVAAYIYFPPTSADPGVGFRDDVLALRTSIEHRGISPLTRPQIDAIAAATRDVAGRIEDHPAIADEAHFAAGTGYVFLADYGPVDEMGEHWQSAADQFARVDPAALPDPADAKRFAFRRAKALAGLGQGDPVQLFGPLANPPVGDDDGGERARLISDVALRMSPPNLKRARLELVDYLGGPPRLPPTELARLKLRLADIYVRLGEPDKARTWFEDIARSNGPAPLIADARYELAKLASAENRWADAAQLLDAAAGASDLPADQRAKIDYEAGMVRLRMGDPVTAAQNFDRVVETTGPAATAAAVRLAELRARNQDVTRAVTLLEQAAVRTTGIDVPLVPTPDARAAFEVVIRACLDATDFTSATRAVSAYEKFAEPTRVRELRAEALTAWGDAFDRQGDAAAAMAKHRDAANELMALAASDPNPTGRADSLRRAADSLRKAGDTPAALAAIEQITGLTGLPPDATAGAWLRKGEILLASHQYAAAEAALQNAMTGPGPTATAARVRLALAQIEQGRAKLAASTTDAARKAADIQIALGRDILAQVANIATTDDTIVHAAKLSAQFELGKLLLQQGSIPDAEARFRQILQLSPAGETAPMAKLYLGSCLLLLARGDHQGGNPPSDADRKLAEARTLFEELADTPDPFLQAQADVRLANTTLLLKKYDEMPALCDRLAKKYAGKVEEVIVLSMLYSAYRFADRQSDATRTLDRMQEAFAQLTPADFPGGAEEYTRDYWQRQWFDVLKPATP